MVQSPDGALDGSSALDTSSAIVSGTVRQPDGAPLPDAVLTITDTAGNQLDRTRSGPAGDYRLQAPHGGTFLLICSTEHHQPSAVLVMVAGPHAHYDVALRGAGRLWGRVLDQDGRPVPRATVSLTDARGAVVAVTAAGEDGVYGVEDLLLGDYVLTATAAGHRPQAQPVVLTDTASSPQDIRLMATGRCAGVVRRATDGAPLPAAAVTLTDDKGAVIAQTLTDGAGAYQFDDLTPGQYTVTSHGYAPTAAHVQVASSERTAYDLGLSAFDVSGRVARSAGDRQVADASSGRMHADPV